MMLKSILPSRKIPDAEFTMLTGAHADEAANGKENYPAVPSNFSRLRGEKSKKSKGKDVNQGVPMEAAFDKLLVSLTLLLRRPSCHCPHTTLGHAQDDLQIPTTLRPKLATMESSVKAAMLKSSQTLSRGSAPQHIPLPPSPGQPHSQHSLRKSHSSQSITSLSSPKKVLLMHDAPRSAGLDDGRGRPFFATHIRTSSLDTPRAGSGTVSSQADGPVRGQSHARGQSVGNGKQSVREKEKSSVSVQKYCGILVGTSTLQLDVETVKKLRLMLRNESARYAAFAAQSDDLL